MSNDLLDSAVVGTDALGPFRVIYLPTDVYPLTAVYRAAYWYTDRYYLFLSYTKDQQGINVTFRAKEGENLDFSIQEFCNSVLDFIIREKVQQETKEIHSIIVKRAFSEALSSSEENAAQRLGG